MTSSLKDKMLVPQPKLGAIGLIALLCIGELVTPMSLDMFTPAIPHMTEYFSASESTVSLTLTGYYLFFAVGMLLFGPLSDRFGRKAPLVAGAAIYVAGGAVCALSPSIWTLITSRVVQALGAGAIAAICMAMIKDCFESLMREKVLAVVQALVTIGPVIAPIIGALIVEHLNWRMTFWVLAAIGVLIVLIAILMQETLPRESRSMGGAGQTISRLAVVSKNPGFMIWVLVVSALEIPYMAYVAVGSYIYMDFFGTTEMGYGLFFAVAAIVMAGGAPLWFPLSRRFSPKTFTTLVLIASALIGIVIATFGQTGVVEFCVCFAIFAFITAIPRPYFSNIALEQQDQDTGSASALLNFIRTLAGVVGMALIVLPWPNYVIGVGVLMTVVAVVTLIGWLLLLRSRIKLVRIKDDRPVGLL